MYTYTNRMLSNISVFKIFFFSKDVGTDNC